MDLRGVAARAFAAFFSTRAGWALTIIVVAAVNVVFTARPAAFSARWIVVTLASNVVDVLAVFAAWRLTIRYPFGRGMPARHLVPHALAAFAYAAADVTMARVVAPALDPDNRYDLRSVTARAVIDVVVYILASGVAHGIEYVRRYKASRSAELRLRADLADLARQGAEAEFRALKAVINPQLMTRALSTVSSLLRTNPEEAERTVVRMGDLMRDAISHRRDDDVTLGEEVDGLEPFIAMLRARFGDGFQLRCDVSEEMAESRAPQMALQALVEVALTLGFDEGADPVIEIHATRLPQPGRGLCVEILNPRIDSRVPQPAVAATAQLVALRERMQTIYGGEIRLEADIAHGRGVVRLQMASESDAAVEAPADDADVGSKRGRRTGLARVLFSAFFFANLVAGIAVNSGAKMRSGARLPLHAAIFESLLYAVILTSVLYVALRIVRRSEHESTLRMHVFAASCFAVVAGLARPLIFLVIGDPYTMPGLRGNMYRAIGGALQYGIFAAIVAAFEYARRYGSAEASGLVLRAQLADAARRRAEAQLKALKLELNPHFLGNALSAVAALIRNDPTRAERVIAQLDKTLREAVSRAGIQEVTLAEEIDSLTSFLAIESARFGNRLAVSWEVEEDARLVHVPHMILQPLVENAVKHGIAPKEGSGRIVVRARRAGEQLELSVRDDGVGVERSTNRVKVAGSGVGLANTRARLAGLYGSDARLDLIPAPDAGTIARLTLPWR